MGGSYAPSAVLQEPGFDLPHCLNQLTRDLLDALRPHALREGSHAQRGHRLPKAVSCSYAHGSDAKADAVPDDRNAFTTREFAHLSQGSAGLTRSIQALRLPIVSCCNWRMVVFYTKQP